MCHLAGEETEAQGAVTCAEHITGCSALPQFPLLLLLPFPTAPQGCWGHVPSAMLLTLQIPALGLITHSYMCFAVSTGDTGDIILHSDLTSHSWGSCFCHCTQRWHLGTRGSRLCSHSHMQSRRWGRSPGPASAWCGPVCVGCAGEGTQVIHSTQEGDRQVTLTPPPRLITQTLSHPWVPGTAGPPLHQEWTEAGVLGGGPSVPTLPTPRCTSRMPRWLEGWAWAPPPK